MLEQADTSSPAASETPIPATPMVSSQLNTIFHWLASTQGLLIGQAQTPAWSFAVSTYQFLLKQNMNY